MICKSGDFKLTVTTTTAAAAATNVVYHVSPTFLNFRTATYLILATTQQGMYYYHHCIQIGK